MKVLVCGSRNWNDPVKIKDRLSKLPPDTLIISGAARGADTMAFLVARSLGLKVQEFKADWDKHGLMAGPIRNRKMLDEKPDLVIAFHEDLAESLGTKDTVNEAGRRGIPVEVIA